MKLTDISEAINPHVTFKHHEDVEGDKNRGFKVDRVDGFIDGEEAGYIKIAYIPEDRFKAHFKGILNFLKNMRGQNTLPYEYRYADYHDVPVEALRKSLVHAYLAMDHWVPSEEQMRLEKLPLDQVLPEYKKIEMIAKKKFGKDFKNFHDYFVDKGYVDFIRTHEKFQRTGVGTALQREAHRWFKSRGMPFYASDTLTPQGKAFWDQIRTEFPTATDKYRSLYGNKPIERIRFAD